MEVAITKTSFLTIRLSAAPRALIIFDRGPWGFALQYWSTPGRCSRLLRRLCKAVTHDPTTAMLQYATLRALPIPYRDKWSFADAVAGSRPDEAG